MAVGRPPFRVGRGAEFGFVAKRSKLWVSMGMRKLLAFQPPH